MPFEVNSKQCSTCIFGANSPVSKVRFAQLKRTWARDDVHQECHHSTHQGQHVVCRGYYNAVENGAIDASQMMRIAARLNAIVFVDVPDTFDKKNEA
jgi:hypothetical protein